MRSALGMDAEGIDVTEAESAFSLSELKLSKSKVDELENAVASSSESEVESDEERDELADSDEEYEELLESQMDKLYDDFLTRRGDDVKTRKAVKRTKVAKRALAGEALVQDAEMFDGDTKAYHKMINAEEVRFVVDLCVRVVWLPSVCVVPWSRFPPFVLSVPGSSVLLLSCLTWGTAKGLPRCLTALACSSVRVRSYVHPKRLVQ